MKERKIKFRIFTILIVAMFIFTTFGTMFLTETAQGADNWWNAGYNYRQLITINSSQVSSTLTNFPVLISIDSDAGLSLNAQPDGDDIHFIDFADNNTIYNHEIEHYSSGTLQAWVNITSLSSTVDTKVWMYYGNPTVSSRQNVTDTWNTNYLGVWHLNDDDLTDSTINGYDATTSGTTDNNNGAVAGCREFTQTVGENISIDSWGGTGSEFTVESWISRTDALQDYPRYMIQGETWNSNSDWCAYGRANSGVGQGFRCTFDTTGGSSAQGGTHPPPGNYFFYMTYGVSESDQGGNGRQTIRTNKTYQHDTLLTGLTNSDTYPYLTFGNDRSPSATSSFNGCMDELRISNINRTIDWLNTTYNTISLNSDFQYISTGEEELAPASDPIVSDPTPGDGATGIQLAPTCSVLVTDPDTDPMDVYFYENTTGSWSLEDTDLAVASGAYATWDNYANADTLTTKYWWSANATDGSTWDNETFYFTTTDTSVIISGISPANNSIDKWVQESKIYSDNPLELDWSALINDTQGDTISWSIECSNGQTAEGSGQPPYNGASLADTAMFTKKWSVSSTTMGHYISSEPVTADVTGDGVEEIFIGGRPMNFDYQTNQYSLMSCLDGATGVELWQTNFTVDYVDSGGVGYSSNQHWCPVVYDFVPSNPGLEVTWSSGMKYHRMYDGATGAVLWNTSDFAGGWHNIGYLDDGDEVYLYTIEGINSIAGYAQDGDEGLTKSYASNGTMIARARHGYECFGGTAIADINDDGFYEVLVTDRGGSQTGVYKGLSCYDEDLNFLWAYQTNTVSTQCPMIADVDGDDDLEVILGSQGGSYEGRIMVFSGDPSGSVGEIEFLSPSSPDFQDFHHQNAIGNTDDDDNLEFFGNGYSGDPMYVYDFIDNTMTYIGIGGGYPGEISNILPDVGENINEIICMNKGGTMKVLQYNTTTCVYDDMFAGFGGGGLYCSVSDVDFDGYKEMIVCFDNRIEVWETNVTVQDPKPITNVAFGGMSRLNNDEFIEPPGVYEFTSYGENNGTKNLSLTGLEMDTTYTVWVNATDDGSGLWNRSIFYFATESSVNLPPIIKNPTPANNTVDYPYNNPTAFTFTLEDPEGDYMAMDIVTVPVTTEHHWGEWFASNDTYEVTFWFQEYNTTYEVHIDAWDQGSGDITSVLFYYTTEAENEPPAFSDVSPANNSFINTNYVNWSINITDDNDAVNWSIACDNGQEISWEGKQYFGSNGTEETGLQSFEGDIIGIPWKMGNVTGLATNISVNMGCSGQSYTVKCALYDENRYYLAETEEKIIHTYDGLSWKSFNFTYDNIILTANKTYYIVAMMNQSDTPAHSCSIVWENESGDNSSVWILTDYGYGEFPEFDYNTSATQWNDNDTTLHMRCYYNSGSSGVKTIFLTDLINGDKYTVWVNATDGEFTINSFYYFTYSDMTVITNASTSIEETNATLNGFLESDGGYLTTVWFELWNGTAYNRTENINGLYLVETSDQQSGIYQAFTTNGSYVFSGMHSDGLGAYYFINDEMVLLDTISGSNNPDIIINGSTIYTASWSTGLHAYHFDYDTETLSYMGNVNDGGSYKELCLFDEYIIVASDPYMYAYSFDGVSTFTLLDSIPWVGVDSFDANDSIIYGVSYPGNLVAFTFDGSSFTELNDDMSAVDSHDVEVDENNYIHVAEGTDGITAYSYDVAGDLFTKIASDTTLNAYRVAIGGNFIYASDMSGHVCQYTFDGSSYTLIDTENLYVTDTFADDRYLYVGSSNNGIYIYDTILDMKYYEQIEYSINVDGLDPGTLYHYRTVGENFVNRMNGTASYFLTKPEAPTGFTATNSHMPSVLNISWTNGTGANTTYIERNTIENWEIGEGTLIYNDTYSYFNDTGLAQSTVYYYRAWSFTNWTYNPTVYVFGDPIVYSISTGYLAPPENGSSTYTVDTFDLNLSWDRGQSSNREIVVQNNNSYPSSSTDGWVRQNSTNLVFNATINHTAYFTIWSYNDSSQFYSLTGLDIPWGVIEINVWDENSPWVPITNYTVFITDEDGIDTYYNTSQNNPTLISYDNIPYGTNTLIQISHADYETRNSYVDLALNSYSLFNFYLPSIETPPGGDGDGDGDGGAGDNCVISAYTNSITVTDPDVDAVITLTYELENIIEVHIYNDSFYGTYGGWVPVSGDKFTATTTTVTVDKSVMDANTTIARASYYYEDCDSYDPPVLYYIRIVESYETDYGISDRSVENAKVQFRRYINTTESFENISTLITDANGYVSLYLMPGILYKVIVTKDRYVTKDSDYQPAPPNDYGQTNEKVFRIEKEIPDTNDPDTVEDNVFKNIVWTLEPMRVQHYERFTIWFNITSSDCKLEWYRMSVHYHNKTTDTWIELYNVNQSNACGGELNYSIPNVTGRYAIECFYKKSNFTEFECFQQSSIILFFSSLKAGIDDFPDLAYFIILIVIMISVMGFFLYFFATGMTTGYIGLIVMGIGLLLKPVELPLGYGDPISGWWIFAVTFLMYTAGLYLWSKI